MDKKEEESDFEEENKKEVRFEGDTSTGLISSADSEKADFPAAVNPIIESKADLVIKTESVEVANTVSETKKNPELKSETSQSANKASIATENSGNDNSISESKQEGMVDIKTENTSPSSAQKEVSEDPFEKLVGKSYVEIQSKDKNSESEKIPLVSNIAKDIEHPIIIQAHSHHHHHHPVKSEYEEVAYEENLRVKPKKMVDKNAVYAGLALAVVIVLTIFLFFFNSEREIISTINEVNETTSKEEPVAFLSIPVKYSFDKYLYPEDNNYNKEVSLICFLRKETRTAGGAAQYIDYYVIDDYGNKIKLNFFRLNNPSSYEYLFSMNNTTKELFNVSGSLRKEGYQELKLYVSSITNAEREYEKKELN